MVLTIPRFPDTPDAPGPAARPRPRPGPDLALARQHLRALARGDGYYELRTLRRLADGGMRPGGSHWLAVHSGIPQALDEAIQWAAAQHQAGYEIFVGYNPRFHDAGKSKDDVGAVAACYLDLDLHGEQLVEAQAALLALPCPPALIIASGRGLHPIWPIQLTSNKARWLQAQQGLARALAAWSPDAAVVGDEARVLRLAPFPNGKAGGPWPTAILHQTATVYPLDELIAALPPPDMSPGIQVGSPVIAPARPGARAPGPEPRIDAAIWIRKARTRQGPGRNDSGFWLACQLRDNGYSESEAERHVLDYAHLVAEAGGHAYTDGEASHSVRSAYRRAPRAPVPHRAPLGTGGAPRPAPPPADIVADLPNAGTDGAAATYEAEVYELIHLLAAETARAEALQAWKDKACAILFHNAALAPGHRVALLALQCFIDEDHLPPGEEVEILQESWAERAGVSPATVCRWLDDWQEMGLAAHDVRADPQAPVCDRQGRPRLARDGRPILKNKTYLACQVAPFAVAVITLSGPQERRKNTPRPQGGLRDCPTCGADGAEQDLLTNSPRQCRTCHTVYASNGTILAPPPEPDSYLQVASNDSSTCKLQADETPLRETAERIRSLARDGHARARQAVNRAEARTRRRYQDADVAAYHAAARHTDQGGQGGPP